MISSGQASSKRDLSVSLEKANVYALLTGGLPALLLVTLYPLVWGLDLAVAQYTAALYPSIDDLLALAVLIAGLILHELIHGVTWKLAGRKPWSAIRFGIDRRTFSPYAHCAEPLPAGVYRLGTLLPGVLTGLVPALAGLVAGKLWATLGGALFVLAAGGDLLVLWVIRELPASALVEDHPTRAGCYVLDPAGKDN